jgi:hypothetical protein
VTWRRVLAALAVLAALVALAWVLEVRRGERDLDRWDRETRLIPVAPEEVRSLRLENEHGSFLLEPPAEREGIGVSEGWTLREPAEAPANPNAVAELLWIVGSGRSQGERMEATPEAVARYGLEPPAVTLTAAGPGGETHSLLLGDETPTLPAAYARLPGGPVRLVDKVMRQATSRDLLLLRDRRLVPEEWGPVAAMRWERPGKRPDVAWRTREGDWRLEEPVAADADDGLAGEVLDHLMRARAARIAAEKGEGDLAEMELDPPRARCVLEFRDGRTLALSFGGLASEPATFGKEPPPYEVFARRGDGEVLVVPGDVLRRVNAPVAHLRESRLARLPRWELRRMRVVRDGEVTAVLESDRERRWRVRVPEERGISVRESEGPLGALYGLRFTSFLRPGLEPPEEAGFDEPWLRVEMTAGERRAEFVVGARLPGAPEERLARVDGEVGTVTDAAAARIEHEIVKLVRDR